jgi:hypothetical protein
MFDKMFFDDLQRRVEKYFDRFPSAKRVGILITTHDAEYLLVDLIEYDERFVTFAHWPRDNADLPESWAEVRDSLAAVIVPYEDIVSIQFDPKIVRGSEIGFSRRPSN